MVKSSSGFGEECNNVDIEGVLIPSLCCCCCWTSDALGDVKATTAPVPDSIRTAVWNNFIMSLIVFLASVVREFMVFMMLYI